jgi:hypothetical protein
MSSAKLDEAIEKLFRVANLREDGELSDLQHEIAALLRDERARADEAEQKLYAIESLARGGKPLSDENDPCWSPAYLDVMDALARERTRASQSPVDMTPQTYAYHYPDGIRYGTGGRVINGNQVTKTEPLYGGRQIEAMQADLARERARLLEEAQWWQQTIDDSVHASLETQIKIINERMDRLAILDRKLDAGGSGAENPEPLSGDPPANSDRSRT